MKSTALSKNRHCAGKCIFEKVDNELNNLVILSLVIFNSFTDISFLKYVTKIFCLLLLSGKNWECFIVLLSVAVFVYILSSKGANHPLPQNNFLKKSIFLYSSFSEKICWERGWKLISCKYSI